MSDFDINADDWGLETLAVRAGQTRSHEGEHSEAIYPTSSFVFGSAAEAAARFSGAVPGNVYSRFTNPTVRMFEQRIAALEGGEQAVATASGMAAILSTCMALMAAGDHIVASRNIFGSTTNLFEKYLKKFGVSISYVDLKDYEAWSSAATENTKLYFLETPSNPICELGDIQKIADIAHSKGAKLVVDNCFCTPALQRPLMMGADIVIHSATKYLDGQGRCVGGVVVGNHQDMEQVVGFVRTCGPSLSPFNAWVFLKGLETLNLRMKAHSENALALAEWLAQQPQVEKVNYSGLASHPDHELAKTQQKAFGAVLSIEVRGGKESAWTVIDSTQMISITANLGDVKSTITHPATTTHARITQDERDAAGIRDGLIRIAVGLETLEDLKADLARGLAKI
ncbi:O-succinylhomoserine sulfhydrylase [Oceanospirillum multiglobuliferum]|uniref:O-succinylhomoserine sulfhydrylase n=1 Tax=Oceanospirillum multiglobuliferum TaxID=64969 RepID=A0A1T4LKV0_9GAMM|nr:O-succinylhomoserine sulfhydrylase [Oceanospirillum multiglobuliferum]OPX56620.1 O-succinylhomoserine sulfhydrylase [Oceanospirillum multiglobuliferum]SJZ55349.1 O-succinylhomoserine sulfhydrylase [Oceanospirillum multiglobuliferum]